MFYFYESCHSLPLISCSSENDCLWIEGTDYSVYLQRPLLVCSNMRNVAFLQYETVPGDYTQTYRHLTRQGARVLALGIREVGSLTYQEVKFPSDFGKWFYFLLIL